jgi:cell division protein FtsB
MAYKRGTKNNIFQYLFFWGIIIYLIIVLVSQQGTLNKTKNQYDDIKEKLSYENKRNEELKYKLKIINTDEFFEKIAREVFGYVKKGEKVYVDTKK